MTGTVGILSVGTGDTKLTFDKNNPQECIRAARIVKDMLRRGYALLVQVGTNEEGRPQYQRALDFDESVQEYIIADFDPVQAEADQGENTDGEEVSRPQESPVASKVASARKGSRKRIPADSADAVAVARSAGG